MKRRRKVVTKKINRKPKPKIFNEAQIDCLLTIIDDRQKAWQAITEHRLAETYALLKKIVHALSMSFPSDPPAENLAEVSREGRRQRVKEYLEYAAVERGYR